MHKRPFTGLPKFPKSVRLAIRFAVGIFILVFLTGYQPNFGIPPLKNSIVHAQATQEQTIESNAVAIVFQLPHPGYISTYFSSYHPALDIATGLGMPIHPIAEGEVIETGYNVWGLGLTVTIAHGQGYRSMYAHLGKTYVKSGQKVNRTDLIGEVGLTGHTSGPHTHLELSRNGVNINPLPLLPSLPDISAAWENVSQSSPSAKP